MNHTQLLILPFHLKISLFHIFSLFSLNPFHNMGIAVADADDLLSKKAALMRQSLQRSQTITEKVSSILGSFDHRLSSLETAMRPIQVRTDSIRKVHENIEKTLKVADGILACFDQFHQAEAIILKGPNEGLENYLQAIADLRSNFYFFENIKGFKSSDNIINHANNLLAKAIHNLEDGFRQLLLSNSKPVEPESLFDCLPSSMWPSSGSPAHDIGPNGKNHSNRHSEAHDIADAVVYTPPDLIPPRVLLLLRKTARQIIDAGYQVQIVNIYRDARTNVLVESLHKIGVEKLSTEDVQKLKWEILEAKIGNWIQFVRIAVKLLFAAEKKVCDEIFQGFDSLSEQCFAEVTTTSVFMLLSFGEAIARSKRSPEKLFVLLDMYEIMQELHSEIGTLFKGKACVEIRVAAMGLKKRLAQTAQETFGDFEEAVEKDATRTAITDGTVHPLTSYVINYVKFIFDYRSTLMQLFEEFEGTESSPQLSSAIKRIMQALQTNLDGKSQQYRDIPLKHFFLMNNIHYVVRSVRRFDVKNLLGDDWVQKHRRIVKQHATQYHRNAWAKVLECLSIQGLASSGGGSSTSGDGGRGSSTGASRSVVKERFKTFNLMFEELHQKQSQWTVLDSELREQLRLTIAEVLLPAYRSFVKRFGSLVDSGKAHQKYIKYTQEDLDELLCDFFQGKSMNETRR